MSDRDDPSKVVLAEGILCSAARTKKALDLIHRHGQTDCAHHKAWVIDQVVRALTGDGYEDWVGDYKGEGPDEYTWDEGIAP